MEENKSMNGCQSGMCQSKSGCCGCGGHKRLLRWALGLFILGFVFCAGVRVGEFKVLMGYGGYDGFGGEQNFGRMMQWGGAGYYRGNIGNTMMQRWSGAVPPQTATASPAEAPAK